MAYPPGIGFGTIILFKVMYHKSRNFQAEMGRCRKKNATGRELGYRAGTGVRQKLVKIVRRDVFWALFSGLRQ